MGRFVLNQPDVNIPVIFNCQEQPKNAYVNVKHENTFQSTTVKLAPV